MILPIKVLEEAIKVRQDEIKKLEKDIENDHEGFSEIFCLTDITNLKNEILKLKNVVKILYDANRL